MNTPPLFSVVCVVKDEASTIENCIESILNQDYPSIEIIVQDGDSTDGTLEILLQYGERVKVESKADSGPSEAFLRAIRRIRGKYWCACLADETLAPGALAKAAEALESSPQTGALIGKVAFTNSQGETIGVSSTEEFSLERYFLSDVTPPFAAAFFRSSLFEDFDYPREALDSGEFIVWLHVGLHAEVESLDEIASTFMYREDAGSNNPKLLKRFMESREAAIRFLARTWPEHPALAGKENLALAGNYIDRMMYFLRIDDFEQSESLLERALGCGAEPIQFRKIASICVEEAVWRLNQGSLDSAYQYTRFGKKTPFKTRYFPRLHRLVNTLKKPAATNLAILEQEDETLSYSWKDWRPEIESSQRKPEIEFLRNLGFEKVVLFEKGFVEESLRKACEHLGFEVSREINESHQSDRSVAVSLSEREKEWLESSTWQELLNKGVPAISWQDIAFLDMLPISPYIQSKSHTRDSSSK